MKLTFGQDFERQWWLLLVCFDLKWGLVAQGEQENSRETFSVESYPLKCHSQTHLAIERAIKSFGQMFRFGEKYIIKSVFKNWKLFSLLECIVLWHPNQVHWNVVLLHKNCKKGFFLFCQSLWSVIIFANPNLQSSHCLGFEDDCASRPDRSCTNRYELWSIMLHPIFIVRFSLFFFVRLFEILILSNKWIWLKIIFPENHRLLIVLSLFFLRKPLWNPNTLK